MSTNYKGTKEEKNALDVYIKLIRCTESLVSRVNANIVKEGLTESQFAILDVLLHLGPMCQKDIGGKLLKSGGNITMVVDNLEKQGYVRREKGKDRRYYMVLLTDKGRDLIERVFPNQLQIIKNEISVLTEEEQIEFQRLCKKIGLQKGEKRVA